MNKKREIADRSDNMPGLVTFSDGFGRIARPPRRHRRQDADDRNHDHQLDQGKSFPDSFHTPKQKLAVAWQMHTRATIASGTTARLTQVNAKGVTKEFFAQILEPEAAVFNVQTAQVTQPGEAPNAGIQKLVANFPDVVEPTRIAVFLSTQSGLTVTLPAPLGAPLWSWIEWTRQNQQPITAPSWIAE